MANYRKDFTNSWVISGKGQPNEHPDVQMQRLAWQKLADFSNAIDDQRGYERAMQALQTTGSERQRLRSRIAWTAHRMAHLPPDSVAILIQDCSLNPTAVITTDPDAAVFYNSEPV